MATDQPYSDDYRLPPLLDPSFSEPSHISGTVYDGRPTPQVFDTDFDQHQIHLNGILNPVEPERSDPDVVNRGTKRSATETSRTDMVYPRKRAVTACKLCRARKTKCNNARPRCRVCAIAGANCIYDDRVDHSSFDPASLLMLQRLNEIIERLDNISPKVLPESGSPDASRLDVAETILNSASQTQEIIGTDDEYMRIPSSRTSPDKILQWPIFEGNFEPDCLVETLFEAESADEPDEGMILGGAPDGEHIRLRPRNHRVSNNLDGEDIQGLVDNFLVNVHTKNPILDADTLQVYARNVAEDGPDWDGKSCLVLLACALGALARPFDRYNKSIYPVPDSLRTSQKELDRAASYFAMARKRIGLLEGAIIKAQCFFLSGVYMMYIMRPLAAWQNFLQASTTYHVYLKGRTKANMTQRPTVTRRLEQRLFWSCFKSECELRVELSLPESSIATMSYPDLFPSPPAEEPIDGSETAIMSPYGESIASYSGSSMQSDRRRTTSFNNQNQQQSWYYYLTEIALRRIGNRILNTFYKVDDYPGCGMTVPVMILMAREFENQLYQWNIGLPAVIGFDYSDFNVIPENEIPYMTRGRQLDYMAWLTRPFLYYAIHHPPDDEFREAIQPFVNKCLDHSISEINGYCIRHRHHGTFFSNRNGAAAAFCIIAAAKCGHIVMPPNWEEVIRRQISTHKYWERESPDVYKARQIMEDLLQEVSGK